MRWRARGLRGEPRRVCAHHALSCPCGASRVAAGSSSSSDPPSPSSSSDPPPPSGVLARFELPACRIGPPPGPCCDTPDTTDALDGPAVPQVRALLRRQVFVLPAAAAAAARRAGRGAGADAVRPRPHEQAEGRQRDDVIVMSQ